MLKSSSFIADKKGSNKAFSVNGLKITQCFNDLEANVLSYQDCSKNDILEKSSRSNKEKQKKALCTN